jgi:hypothetical protein
VPEATLDVLDETLHEDGQFGHAVLGARVAGHLVLPAIDFDRHVAHAALHIQQGR